MKLSNDEISRYSRQLLIPELGVEGEITLPLIDRTSILPIMTSGQSRLLQSSVLVVGAGGLGAAVILYLAAAGIGTYNVSVFTKMHNLLMHVRKNWNR